MSKTDIFFSRFEGTRGEKAQIFRTLAFYVGIKSVYLLTKTHDETNEKNDFGQIILGVFYAVINIIFVLWTILVAKSARREIKDGVE